MAKQIKQGGQLSAGAVELLARLTLHGKQFIGRYNFDLMDAAGELVAHEEARWAEGDDGYEYLIPLPPRPAAVNGYELRVRDSMLALGVYATADAALRQAVPTVTRPDLFSALRGREGARANRKGGGAEYDLHGLSEPQVRVRRGG